jgi:hypothetical protein
MQLAWHGVRDVPVDGVKVQQVYGAPVAEQVSGRAPEKRHAVDLSGVSLGEAVEQEGTLTVALEIVGLPSAASLQDQVALLALLRQKSNIARNVSRRKLSRGAKSLPADSRQITGRTLARLHASRATGSNASLRVGADCVDELSAS